MRDRNNKVIRLGGYIQLLGCAVVCEVTGFDGDDRVKYQFFNRVSNEYIPGSVYCYNVTYLTKNQAMIRMLER